MNMICSGWTNKNQTDLRIWKELSLYQSLNIELVRLSLFKLPEYAIIFILAETALNTVRNKVDNKDFESGQVPKQFILLYSSPPKKQFPRFKLKNNWVYSSLFAASKLKCSNKKEHK